ncbi:MAG: nickel pincer cofactor biosynthesis protein LarB [Candidatus Lokiarchaeota archaeon]|nr:nickel pincer cofactor biosynthesis protein LarB [Candidatus Lokiarchaeota archaeon]
MKEILQKLLEKKISSDEAEKLLKANLIEEVGDVAKLDVFRKTRTGIPEVIFAQNKDPQILVGIISGFLDSKKFAIISRYNEEQRTIILENFSKNKNYVIEINDLGKVIVINERSFKFTKKGGIVGIITAGSSDIPVAAEAEVIVKAMGCEVISSYDVGIAGIHRIFTPLSTMIKNGVHVIIVCAGMEGTLPGVVAALVDVPVIGVPISSGYGLGEKGKGALITMLQSCSPGLLVVNIDNGFGAGASAAMVANKIAK